MISRICNHIALSQPLLPIAAHRKTGNGQHWGGVLTAARCGACCRAKATGSKKAGHTGRMGGGRRKLCGGLPY